MTTKEATRWKMLQNYKEKGAQRAVEIGREMMHSSLYANDIKFKTDLHGEITECILEILIREEMRLNPKARNWFWIKSFVLKDRESFQRDFLTEIDFVLFTEQCIYLFECKSYAGNKQLIGNGTIVRDKGNSFDVYKQSKLHLQVFENWFNAFTEANKIPVYQMCLFNVSNGDLVDKRTRASRLELPCLGIDNVLTYIHSQTSQDIVWDLNTAAQAAELLKTKQDIWHKDHLRYVTALHGGR